MKIILIGASGTIGRSIHAELQSRHEVITASSKNGSVKVDITSADSIRSMYSTVGKFDALVCCAGIGYFGPFDGMKEEDFYLGIRSKMMGQVNLVMQGKDLINDNGSFTLISGILAEDPVKGSAGLALTNGAINAFVKAASREMSRGIRINVVSPGLVEDSYKNLGLYFPGHNIVAMKDVNSAYVKGIEGNVTGEVLRVY